MRRWSLCLFADVCVSCTTDNGFYYVFDVRQAFDKAAFTASLATPVRVAGAPVQTAC